VTPEQWERLKPFFAEALSMAPEERAAYVEKLREKEAELASDLVSLLNEDAGLLDERLIDFSQLPYDSLNVREGNRADSETITSPHLSRVLAGRFRILRELGRGGMGEVYEAEDVLLRDRVALKTIRPEIAANPAVAERFKREILLGKRISNPHVCRIHDLGTDRGADGSETLFLTMEFLRGETLSQRLRRGPMIMSEAFPLLADMADGLAAAHRAQVVHRDFKSANVMLLDGVGRRGAVITDFGLAKAIHETAERGLLTKPGGAAGTVSYMAPEQIRGEKAGPAADIYALGVVAYQMVTGKLPFAGESDIAVANQHLNRKPPSPRTSAPDLDEHWEAAILTCLKKDPAERFSEAGDFAEALRGQRKGPQRTWEGLRRRRTFGYPAWFLAVAAVVALAAAVYALWPTRPMATKAALRWYNMGVDAIREGSYYTAVRSLQQSLKESPGYPLTHASLAEAWLELDSPDRADEEMLQATAPGAGSSGIGSRDRGRLQAIHHLVTRDFTKAIADYKNLLDSAPGQEKPRALVDLGRALERAKDPKKALEAYQSAVAADPNYAGAWLRLSVIEGQLERSQEMTAALRQAESLYQAASNFEGTTEVYYQRAAYATGRSQLNDAAEWAERARAAAIATGNPQQEIRALYQLGKIAYERGKPAEAQKLAEDASRAALANNLEFLAERGYLDLGNAVQSLGQFEKAGEYFNELLRISHKYNNGFLEAQALYSLGTLANRSHVDESGEHQVERALTWFNANGYPLEGFKCLVMLGRFRRNRGDFVGAEEAFNKHLALAEAAHNELQETYALSSLVSVLILQERFPEALDRADKWLEISTRIGESRQPIYARAALARIYCELGMFAESEEAYTAAESAAHKSGLEELLVNLTVTRARLLFLSGRTAEAASAADLVIKSYLAKYPVDVGDMLGIKAVALRGEHIRNRQAWCAQGLELVKGSASSRLALELINAQLLLEAGDLKGVLHIYPEISASFERQLSEYSLFQIELIAAQAYHQLGQSDAESLTRARKALDLFRRQVIGSYWDRFQKRIDFQAAQKNSSAL
jgi:tetratricopeptide (TPR) repeat protein